MGPKRGWVQIKRRVWWQLVGLVLALLTSGRLAGQAPLVGSCRAKDAPDLTTVEATPDTPPQLTSPGPRTPKFALRDGYRGTVQLAVIVDSAGRAEATGATIIAASDAQMREWACDYVRQLRFSPARLAGRAVRSQVVVPFTFQAFVVRRPG